MELTEIRALDKRLRDGRHLVIDLISQDDSASRFAGYWMRATLDGSAMPWADRFTAPVERNASPVPGLPHVIRVRFDDAVSRPVGLSDAEADGIDAAKREWRERPARTALEAAPDAPTRVLRLLSFRPMPGDMMLTADGPVMILAETRRMWTEDGPSFHLDAEEGYVYDARVRDLTDAERAEWDAEHEDDDFTPQAQVTAGPGGMRVISGPPELAEPALRYLLDGGTAPAGDVRDDATDITWAAVAAAGINTDHVSRRPGTSEYVLVEGGVKVTFGPSADAPRGYDICLCHRDGGGWAEIRQEWAGTADEMLRLVTAAVES